MKPIRAAAILLIILIISCTSDPPEQTASEQARLLDSLDVPESIQELDSLILIPPDAKPLNNISFSDSTVVGEQYLSMAPPPPFAGGPKIAVDSNDRVYMVNQVENTINVFSPDGSKLENIGRKGRGPGEFEAINGIDILENILIANDAYSFRIQTFSIPSGELHSITKIEPQKDQAELNLVRPHMIFLHSDSTYLAKYLLNLQKEQSYYGYYLLNSDAKIISDAIFKIQRQKINELRLDNNGVASFVLPFGVKGISTIDDHGQIYQANSSQFLIKVYEPSGSYSKAFYHPYKNDPLEEEEVLNYYNDKWHNTIRKADFPDRWPALESLLVDDKGRMWISTIVDDKKVYEWWVLKPSSELLATFTWPREEEIEAVRNGKMYVSVTDREKGIKQVIRYDIEMEQK